MNTGFKWQRMLEGAGCLVFGIALMVHAGRLNADSSPSLDETYKWLADTIKQNGTYTTAGTNTDHFVQMVTYRFSVASAKGSTVVIRDETSMDETRPGEKTRNLDRDGGTETLNLDEISRFTVSKNFATDRNNKQVWSVHADGHQIKLHADSGVDTTADLVDLVSFTDQALASKVAKALNHAVELCKK